MKTLLKMAALIACMGLTSCLDLGMKMKVSADKSADVGFKLEMLDQMYQMIIQSGQQMGMDVTLINEEGLRGMVKENGGTVRKFSNNLKDGIRTIDIDATFKDAPTMFDKTAQGLITLKQEEDGTWMWRFLDGDVTESFNNMSDELLEQQLAFMMPNMAGLKFKLDIEVPKLLDTNLKKVNGTTARFEIDFDRDIAGKTGKEATKAFRDLLSPKWIKYQ